MKPATDADARRGQTNRLELEYLESPDEHLTTRQRRWMDEPGPAGRALQTLLYGVNRCGVKLLFRPHVEGLEHVPETGPFILAPNHTSSLDPFVLSAVLGYHRIRQTCWAGRRGALLSNRARRYVNRLAHAIPVQRDLSALAVGAAALRRNRILVWFPEGHRSDDGRIQRFKRGVGVLMDYFQTPAIPAFIHGAYAAMPRRFGMPRRLTRISIAFGRPLDPAEFGEERNREQRIERLVEVLRKRVVRLGRTLVT